MYPIFSECLYVQQIVKKPKMMKHLRNNSLNIQHLEGRSAHSPVVSQMSYMSNPSEFIKMPGGREPQKQNTEGNKFVGHELLYKIS